MIFTFVALSIVMVTASISLSGAWSRSPEISSEYLNSSYTADVIEIDVLSLGISRDSIHTMRIIENSYGFSENNDAFAILLYLNEIVKVTVDTDGVTRERRFGIPTDDPFRFICDAQGNTALVIGLPDRNLIAPAVFMDLNTGNGSVLEFGMMDMYPSEIQISGRTLLIVTSEYAECRDITGNIWFHTDSINRTDELFLTRDGENLLLVRDHSGRGSTIDKLDLHLRPVWVLDTGRNSVSLHRPDQDHIGFCNSVYRNSQRENVYEITAFDLESGEILYENESIGTNPIEYTSPNGSFWCRINRNNQNGNSLGISAGFTLLANRMTLYNDTIQTPSSFTGLGTKGISDTGSVLFLKVAGYESFQYILVNMTGKTIWMSETFFGDEFPSFTGLYSGNRISTSTDLFSTTQSPARIAPSGNRVIYNDLHAIRIVTFSETP
ncbi:MAG: hypothetical protein K8S62_15810 [Candidatus Sabulitectum sp.]|nr:hypothetical protein [Candidatus Sabulitectum sp.]